MKNFITSILRTSLLQVLAFGFAIIGIGIGWSAWTTINTSQGATGQVVSQSLMQGIIENLNDLNSRVDAIPPSPPSPRWSCIVSGDSPKRCSGNVILSGSMNNFDMHGLAGLYCAQALDSTNISSYDSDGHCCMYSLASEGKWWITDGYQLPNSQGANSSCDNEGWCRGAGECGLIQ